MALVGGISIPTISTFTVSTTQDDLYPSPNPDTDAEPISKADWYSYSASRQRDIANGLYPQYYIPRETWSSFKKKDKEKFRVCNCPDPYSTFIYEYTDVKADGCVGTKKKACSYVSTDACPLFGNASAISAVSSNPAINENGVYDNEDPPILCTYLATDFDNDAVNDYISQNTSADASYDPLDDDNLNNVIYPILCAGIKENANCPDTTTLESRDGIPMCSAFSILGDFTLGPKCRAWANNSAHEKRADEYMTTYCTRFGVDDDGNSVDPNCECINRATIDPLYTQLKATLDSSANDACWYAPCATGWGTGALIESKERSVDSDDCPDVCANILVDLQGSTDISESYINQNITCSGAAYINSDDDDDDDDDGDDGDDDDDGGKKILKPLVIGISIIAMGFIFYYLYKYLAAK